MNEKEGRAVPARSVEIGGDTRKLDEKAQAKIVLPGFVDDFDGPDLSVVHFG